MSIQDLGALGELIAAIATVATLIYLAVQLKQNTKALRSATFQQISSQMGQNIEVVVQSSEVADLIARLLSNSSDFTPAEKVRVQGVFVMSMRRLESVFVQSELQSLDAELARGFETSLLPLLTTKEGIEWWESAQSTFHNQFVNHVNKELEKGRIQSNLPSMTIHRATDDA